MTRSRNKLISNRLLHNTLLTCLPWPHLSVSFSDPSDICEGEVLQVLHVEQGHTLGYQPSCSISSGICGAEINLWSPGWLCSPYHRRYWNWSHFRYGTGTGRILLLKLATIYVLYLVGWMGRGWAPVPSASWMRSTPAAHKADSQWRLQIIIAFKSFYNIISHRRAT